MEEEAGPVKLCKEGIFPKLHFLLESRDDRSLKEYFESPTPDPHQKNEASASSAVHKVPLSTSEREKVLAAILERFLQADGSEWWRKLSSKSRADALIFLSENHDGSRPWSSKGCEDIVVKICNEICNKGKEDEGEELKRDGTGSKHPADLRPWFVSNFQDSLTSRDTDFHNILQLVRAKFNKAEWKYFPAGVYGFGWIVKQIPYPFLGNDVDLVIPPALLFTDDYYEDNKVLGLECLSHIVHNVDKSDLNQSNWALVIYDAVMPLCSEKDSAVIQIVMPILLKVLLVIEKDPEELSSEITKYDHLLKEIIFITDMSSDINIKRTWLLLLDGYLNKIGTATLRWSDKLCSMLRDSTVCNDCALWNTILQVTATVVKNTWIKPDCRSISEIILRVLLNSATFQSDINSDLKKEIIQNAAHCFELLRKCDGFEKITSQLQEIMDQGNTKLLHPEFIKVLKNVLSD